MEIIIVGLGAGGLFAAIAAKRQNRDAKVTVVEKRAYEMYSPCGMPFYLAGKVDSIEKLKHSANLDSMHIQKMLNCEVFNIDKENGILHVEDLTTHEPLALNYDSLIIATGSSALIPPIPNAQNLYRKGVFSIDTLEDVHLINEWVKTNKKVVVVGAGAIGLETAHALSDRCKVTVVEMLGSALPKSIDEDMSKIVEEYLAADGITLLFNKKIEQINGVQKLEGITVSGEMIESNTVIIAAGVKPNLGIAQKAGITIGQWGIQVNERMLTSHKNIYAVGDCVQIQSLINHKPWMMQLAVAAYQQGTVAGINAAGGSATYKGALTTFVSKIGEIEVAATGFNSVNAKDYDILPVKVKGRSKPEWYPGSSEITLKLVVDRKSRKLLGGQAIAREGAAWRVNVISLAISAGMTVDELSKVEFAYCPAISETYDVLSQAADLAVRRL